MIEAPPVLTLRREFARPDPALLAQLEAVPTSLVADALGGRGAMDYRIKPLPDADAPPSTFVGTALTCGCGPADNLAVIAALARAQPGDVIVASTDACVVTALVGDRVMGMARNAGVRCASDRWSGARCGWHKHLWFAGLLARRLAELTGLQRAGICRLADHPGRRLGRVG